MQEAKSKKRKHYQIGTVTLAQFKADANAFEIYQQKMVPYAYKTQQENIKRLKLDPIDE